MAAVAAAGCAEPASLGGDARARRIEARATVVTDGDTLRARATGSGRRYDVRLIGIDTDTRDRYGRLLAHVTRRDGFDLARSQLRAGWGEVYVYDRAFTRLESFESAQRAARAERLGVWAACAGDFHRPR